MNIIAYGSLMNQKSLEETLKRRTNLKQVTVPNVQRVFNAPFGKFAFLNLVFVKESFIEAAYFVMEEKELIKFSKREEGAELVEVSPGFFAFVWPKKYYCSLPVLQSYIDFCSTASSNLKIDLWKGTARPKFIFDDRKKPKYF